MTTGYFLDLTINRQEAARYGLTVEDVQEVIETAIGGMNLTTTVEGRERYPVNIRYARELRGDIEQLKRILVPVMMPGPHKCSRLRQAWVPVGRQPGNHPGPPGRGGRYPDRQRPHGHQKRRRLLSLYVYIDFSGRDVGGYVDEAKKKVASLKIPDGYRLEWSGEYEYLIKTQERLKLVIPLTLLIIFVLIFSIPNRWPRP